MPHSSGGGSHGGGSHGGGHGGSHGGSGSSGPRISRSRFSGSRRYVTYHNGEPRYFYASKNFNPKFDPKRLLIGIFYIPFLIFIFLSFKSIIPIVPKNYNHNIVITDDADVIADEWELRESLDRFMEKTGVTPSVVTVYDDMWAGKTLEEYAYDRYLSEFNDEMHWLIVYSKPKIYTSTGYVDWKWEGMQGDDTDPVLKERETQKFNSYLQRLLEDDTKNVGTSIAESFDYITNSFSRFPNLSALVMPLFMLGFILFHAYFMLGLNELKYRKAVPAPEEGIDDPIDEAYGGYEIKDKIADIASSKSEKMCPYCGGYFSSNLTRCPHCNARSSDDYQ